MSDTSLKAKIQMLISQSSYTKSDKLICPIVKIISMRYPSHDKIYAITKSLL
ncbi:MAG: hypothetical protein COA39_006430 [Sulfurimonas sp.]|nr:hypothetical protein [Sulfurimonas sp.]